MIGINEFRGGGHEILPATADAPERGALSLRSSCGFWRSGPQRDLAVGRVPGCLLWPILKKESGGSAVRRFPERQVLCLYRFAS